MRTSIQNLTRRMPAKKLDYAVNISLKNRYVYIETPKVACSSLKDLLIQTEYLGTEYRRNYDVHERQRSPLIQLSQLPASQGAEILADPTWFRFAFVRNPFTRALSAYLDKVVRNRPEKRVLLTAIGRGKDPIETELSFIDFLRAIEAQEDFAIDAHFRPQFQVLLCRYVSYHFIGAFEKLDSDVGYLCQRLDVEGAVKLKSVGAHETNAAKLLDQYYGDEEIAAVRRIYYADFKYFGYQLPIASFAEPPTRKSWAIGDLHAS